MEVDGKTLYEFKIKHPRMTWAEVGERFELSKNQARKRSQKYYKQEDLPPPSKARIQGSIRDEPKIDKEEIWERAVGISDRKKQTVDWERQRSITYDEGPLYLVFMGDLHLGSAGTDYRQLDMDITILNELDKRGHVAVVLMGDLLDSFIVGRLKALRMHSSPFLQIEEWQLVDYALERMARFIVGSVAGNHDNWSWSLVGVDILKERHRQLNPGILYDKWELAFNLAVDDFSCRIMCRHKWRGSSMFNPTHGMDHHHHTRGREFDIGVGAHTHRGALAREFDNGGKVGHALIVGSYKKEDNYVREEGFPPALEGSAVAAVIDEKGIHHSTSRLDTLLSWRYDG